MTTDQPVVVGAGTQVPVPAAATPADPRGERGAVTAETVVAIPILVGVTLGLVWLVVLAATQVRLVDAAREVARAVARDEPRDAAIELGRRVAPSGATFRVVDHGKTVTVTVGAEIRGPGGLFRFLPALHTEADAVAAQEEP